jgi:hypothetical protein
MSSLILQISSSERYQSMRERFVQGGEPTELALVLLALAGLFALLLGLQAFRRRRQQEPNRPAKLFSRLISGLQLTVAERDLIRRIARDSRLENPAVLFVSRAIYEAHGERWLQEQKADGRRLTDQLERLGNRLFGDRSKAPGATAMAD